MTFSESFPTDAATGRMVEPKVEAAGIEPARHSPRTSPLRKAFSALSVLTTSNALTRDDATSFPSVVAVMAYEARFALQQIEESVDESVDESQLVEIIEPLARAVGWAEALAYASFGMFPVVPSGNGRVRS